MCTTAAGIQALTTLVGAGEKISSYKNSKYKEKLKRNEAKLLENEGNYQKQEGIEQARLKKIEGIQEASRKKAQSAANGFDINSETNAQNIEDTILSANSQAENIKEDYLRSAQSYYEKAKTKLQSAQEEKIKRKNNLFKFSMQGLGSSTQASEEWYNI